MNKEDIIKQLRDWKYMSGETRNKERINKSGEVFTPDWLVDEMVTELISSVDITDSGFTFHDSSCGDGQLLVGVLIALLKAGISYKDALSRVTGTDIMMSNIRLCHERLSLNDKILREIVERNIKIGNCLDDILTVESLFSF